MILSFFHYVFFFCWLTPILKIWKKWFCQNRFGQINVKKFNHLKCLQAWEPRLAWIYEQPCYQKN